MRRYPRAIAILGITLGATTAFGFGTLPVRTGFDTGPEGWTLPVSVDWRLGGNPGGMLYGSLDEPTNTTAIADASPAYLGDLSPLDGIGALLYDHRKFSPGGGTILSYAPHLAFMSGPGGAASWRGSFGPTSGETDWVNVSVPLRQADWSVTSGTWPAILANVTKLSIELELESSTLDPDDKNGLDNVILTLLGDANLNGRIDRDDVALTDRGAAMNLSGWSNGDFNGDHVVNAQDYAILDNSFSRQPPVPEPLLGTVPEPSAVACVLGLAVSLRTGRRRR
jgi:hypothetical protein